MEEEKGKYEPAKVIKTEASGTKRTMLEDLLFQHGLYPSLKQLGKELSDTLNQEGWQNLIKKDLIIDILKKYNLYEHK